MSKRSRTLLTLAVFLLVLLPAGWVGACEFTRRSLQAGYDAVQVGDPRQRVIELMGPPSTVEPCLQTPNCTKLFYYAFFERWIIFVDSNDKVIGKVNHEGFF